MHALRILFAVGTIFFCSYLYGLETLEKVGDVGGDSVICYPHVGEVADLGVRVEAVDNELDGDGFILLFAWVQCHAHFHSERPVFCNVLV